VTYGVTRSEDATQPRIDAGIDGITVVLPTKTSQNPKSLLLENAEWVLDKKAKFDRYRANIPDRTFEPGEQFPYLGKDYELVIEPRQKSEVVDGTIRLRQSAVSQSSVECALRNFYRREAREYLSKRLDHYGDEMGLEYDSVEIRNQRTRWGSCSTSGTISLNWRLLMAPSDVIDYVIVHELAHLQEPNHTEAFWSIVGQQIDGYQKYADWLERNSTQLIFSKKDV